MAEGLQTDKSPLPGGSYSYPPSQGVQVGRTWGYFNQHQENLHPTSLWHWKMLMLGEDPRSDTEAAAWRSKLTWSARSPGTCFPEQTPREGGAEPGSALGTPGTELAEVPSRRGSFAGCWRPRKPGARTRAEQGALPGALRQAGHSESLAGASSALPGRSAQCAAGLVGGFFLFLGMGWGPKSVLDGRGNGFQSFPSNFSSSVHFPS